MCLARLRMSLCVLRYAEFDDSDVDGIFSSQGFAPFETFVSKNDERFDGEDKAKITWNPGNKKNYKSEKIEKTKKEA